jgi:hypothetical protein
MTDENEAFVIEEIDPKELPADKFSSTVTMDRNLDKTLAYSQTDIASQDDMLGNQEIRLRSYDGMFEITAGCRSALIGDQAIPALIEALQAHIA